MNDRAKNIQKGFVTEEDISTILRSYPATTILTLLQEVAQSPDGKIDWKALVRKTDTKISNAREYQMVWRHLAYRHALLEKFEDEEPLDDDSDLDYEVEAFPAVNAEASAEAAACVKVLIASGLPSEVGVPNNSTVEAPLTINIPNGHSSKFPVENSLASSSLQGTNITVPVSVQKQSSISLSGQKHSLLLATSSEAIGANTSASSVLPPRKKRKPWSEEEDMELIAAVQKCGEGNWANILKGDFKGDRSASQLSQRWTILRKKKSNLSVGGSTQVQVNTNAAIRAAFGGASKQPSAGNPVNSNHAILKAPKEESVEVINASQSRSLIIRNSQSQSRGVPDMQHEFIQSTGNMDQPQNQSHHDAVNGVESQEQSLNQSHQVRSDISQSQQQPHQATDDVAQCQSPPVAQSQLQPPQGTDHVQPLLQSHQSADGVQPQQGVNPTSSTAKAHHPSGATTPLSMLKSRPAPKKVPVKPTLSPDSMVKAAAVAAGARIASPSEATLFKAAQAKNAVRIMSSAGTSTNSLPSSVHYIRTSMSATAPSMTAGTSCQITESQQLRGNVKSSSQNIPLPQSCKVAKLTVSSERTATLSENPANEHQQKQDTKSLIQMKSLTSSFGHSPNLEIQEDLASASCHLSSDKLDKKQHNLSREGSLVANQTTIEGDLGSQSTGIAEKSSEDFCNKDVEMRNAEDHCAVPYDNVRRMNGKEEKQPNLTEANDAKLEASTEVDSAETLEQ